MQDERPGCNVPACFDAIQVYAAPQVEHAALLEAIMGEYNAFELRRPYGFLLILFWSILS